MNAAIEYARDEVFARLVELGASVEQPAAKTRGALHSAAKVGRVDIAKLLLEKGTAVDSVDENGCTPLLLALRHGHRMAGDPDFHIHLPKELLQEREKMVSLLLEAGASSRVRSDDGWSPMELAIRNGPLSVVELVHKKGGCDLNEKNPNSGETPLSLALTAAPVETVLFCLLNGGDSNTRLGPNDETLAMTAAQQRPPQFLRVLLSNGANAKLQDKKGMTALMHAIKAQAGMEIIEVLTQDGVSDLRAVDSAGKGVEDYVKKSKDKLMQKYFKEMKKTAGNRPVTSN